MQGSQGIPGKSKNMCKSSGEIETLRELNVGFMQGTLYGKGKKQEEKLGMGTRKHTLSSCLGSEVWVSLFEK